MSQKKINYLARTFDDYKAELINFSNKYYPELSDNYNDSSIGAWFIDLVSAVGDNLSYHIDTMYNESNINSANLKNTVLNIARTNGLKVPGPKASMCEIRLTCTLPVGNTTTGSISEPDWNYAPIVKRSTIVSAGNLNFQLTEDVDFGQQFNKEGFSNRTFVPIRSNNGTITGYSVSKTTLAVNGSTRVFKKVILGQEVKPFMEVVLPEKNVMNIESIIFKETSNFNYDPDTSDFYIDAEMYKTSNQSAFTYRFFEVDSLAEQYRFGSKVNMDANGFIKDYFVPEMYEDEDGYRYYLGEWKALTQKFITEYTDNGYMKIIFGSGVMYEDVPTPSTTFSKRMMSNIINNDMLGVLPREGWTMYVLYRVGGGVSSNIGVDAINNISLAVTEFKGVASDSNIKGAVINSLKVMNTSPAIAGKDAPSVDEIKYLIKYNNAAQDRCVTVKDYKARVMMMPPKFGSPFRVAATEDNNKIKLSLLGLDSNGKLTTSISNHLTDNIVEYLSHYKTLGDYVEVKSGKIYNLGFNVNVFVDKTYDVATVVVNVINKIKEYMAVEKHDIGENIFIGDLQKEIMQVDGVISIIEFGVYSIYNGNYSPNACPFPEFNEQISCGVSKASDFTINGADSFQIDLESIEHVLSNDYDGMFEIKNDTDIVVKTKVI